MSKKEDKKFCAALAYVVIGLIWYLTDEAMQKDKMVKFHVQQGTVLFIFSVLWTAALNILFSIFFFSPLYFLWAILHILSYVPLILAIVGILNVLNAKQKQLPIIGKYAKKINF